MDQTPAYIGSKAHTTRETGNYGEDLAVEYLLSHGFDVLERNWRHGRYELDVIASHADTLHIIEVKTRKAHGLTIPEEAMTLTKFDFLCKAAESYIGQTELDLDIQFDLIAIDLYENGTYALRYLPNVMSPRW